MSGPVTVERAHVQRWRRPLLEDEYIPWRKGFDSRFYPIGDLPAFMEWPLPGEFDPRELDRYCEWTIWQEDRCAICGDVERGRRLHLDHDHDTGLVRGLLCPPCNRWEGTASHSAFNLWRSGMNPCRVFAWDYLWQGWGRTKRLAPEETLALTRSALIREARLEREMHEWTHRTDAAMPRFTET